MGGGHSAQLRPTGLSRGTGWSRVLSSPYQRESREGWVGGVKNPRWSCCCTQNFSRSHISPPASTIPSTALYSRLSSSSGHIFHPSFNTPSSPPAHIHPINESFCAEHLIVCKLWSSFWAAATTATVSSWLTTRTGSAAAAGEPRWEPPSLRQPRSVPSLLQRLLPEYLHTVQCTGYFCNWSLHQKPHKPCTRRRKRQSLLAQACCSNWLPDFMLFLRCSHTLVTGECVIRLY